MTLAYILHDAGWATAIIEHDGNRREMVASYLTDAVRRMLEAAVGLMRGTGTVRFGFTDEPGEHECVVTQIGPGEVNITVYWYKDWTPPGRDTGEVVFFCNCSAIQLCEAIFVTCKRLLDEHGEEGYKSKWLKDEFPTETFERLSCLLYPPPRPNTA